MYIAIVSTTVETGSPEQELKAGLDLLGPVLEKYVRCVGCYYLLLLIIFRFAFRLVFLSQGGRRCSHIQAENGWKRRARIHQQIL
mmetsp:Transcript_36744/g.95132  ORF Transcript_36744/g.95132 Transcript_36744/m.95132 type:complete len:85 (-) Transcript_36744:1090-1344(-)